MKIHLQMIIRYLFYHGGKKSYQYIVDDQSLPNKDVCMNHTLLFILNLLSCLCFNIMRKIIFPHLPLPLPLDVSFRY